jgi:hypothetical protein
MGLTALLVAANIACVALNAVAGRPYLAAFNAFAAGFCLMAGLA